MAQNRRAGVNDDSRTLPLRGRTKARGSHSGPERTSRRSAIDLWLESPSVATACRVALGAWALVSGWNLASAVIDHREGAWFAIGTGMAVFLAALLSSIAGFAFSALAGSALAYLEMDPLHAVQTMVLCSIATQLYAVCKLRRSVVWNELWPMVVAGSVTIPAGVWLLGRVPGVLYAVGLGIFLIIYGCYLVVRGKPRVIRGNPWHDAAAGALGGIAGGLAGLPGVFVTIWCSMRGWDKLRQRAVYQPYILAMQLVTLACLRWQSPKHANIAHDVGVVPFALLGAVGGLALFQRMTTRQFQWVVSVLLVVSGIGLLARGL